MSIQKMKLVVHEILFVFLLAWGVMPSPVFPQGMSEIEAEILAEMGDTPSLSARERADAERPPAGIRAFEATPPENTDARDRMEGNDLEGLAALFIPHAGIAAGLIVVLALIWLILKFRELSHKERLAAIERGLPVTEALDRKRLLLGGMILFVLGGAIVAALWGNFGWPSALWGLLPLLSGLALFLYAAFGGEDRGEEKTVSV